MKTIEQLIRRRMWANRLSRWAAMLFFILGTFFYTIDSDVAKILIPIRTISVFGLLIAGVLFIVQFIEWRRFRSHPPIVVITGIILSFLLAGYIYLYEFGSYRELDLNFENQGVTLEGTLYLPSESGVYPMAVIAQGSIKAPRRLYHVWADMLVRKGIAVYSFDKRGTGGSGGEYESENNSSDANLALLASDVESAVRAVREHPEIDPTAVGIIGVSMGGWTAPVAAESAGDVAFMILLSGPTVSVGEENYFSDLTGEGHEDGQGLSPDSITALVAVYPPSGFDPRGVLQRLDVPSLWLFGRRDLSIPVPKCSAELDTLIQVYDRPFGYRTYERANHLLVEPDWPFDFPDSLETDMISFIRSTTGSSDGHEMRMVQ